jgi:hypothetical protein
MTDTPTTNSDGSIMNGTRKFMVTAFITVVGSVALFASKLDQGGYVTLMTMVLTIYGAANVIDKKLGGAG